MCDIVDEVQRAGAIQGDIQGGIQEDEDPNLVDSETIKLRCQIEDQMEEIHSLLRSYCEKNSYPLLDRSSNSLHELQELGQKFIYKTDFN